MADLSQTAYPSRPGLPEIGGGLPGAPEPQLIPSRHTNDEPALFAQPERAYVPPVGAEIGHEDQMLDQWTNLAFGHLALQLDWYNDDQYGYPPPGAPNEQAFQSGHTSITVINQSAEQGYGKDPAFTWPRYPHMENHFPGYATGTLRRNGEWTAAKIFADYYGRTQQLRDLLVRDALTHRQHGVVVADAPSVSNTYNVPRIDPTLQAAESFGEAGVPPNW